MNRAQLRMRSWFAAAVLAATVCLAPAAAGEAPAWQPMLGKSFPGDVRDLGITGVIVYRNPGCVFLQVKDKVYCSAPGAGKFNPVKESWQDVNAHAQKKRSSEHVFVLTKTNIKESIDGGATWLKPIALPKDFVVNSETTVQHDAANDTLYLMKKGGDLYKLARRK